MLLQVINQCDIVLAKNVALIASAKLKKYQLILWGHWYGKICYICINDIFITHHNFFTFIGVTKHEPFNAEQPIPS